MNFTVHHSVKLCIHRSLYFRLKEKEYLLCWSKLKHLFEHPTVDFSWWPIQDSLLSLSNLQHISTLCSWHCFRSWVAKRSSKAAMKIKHPDLKYWYLDYTCIRYITNPTAGFTPSSHSDALQAPELLWIGPAFPPNVHSLFQALT